MQISATIKTRLCNISLLAQVLKNRYNRDVLNKERFTGTDEEILKQHPSSLSLGKAIRKSDATKMLRDMESVESNVAAREQQAHECENRIERMLELHRLNMDYLISYGIHAEKRSELFAVLQEVSEHGGLAINESIDLANARAERAKTSITNVGFNHSLNGPLSSGASDGSE